MSHSCEALSQVSLQNRFSNLSGISFFYHLHRRVSKMVVFFHFLSYTITSFNRNVFIMLFPLHNHPNIQASISFYFFHLHNYFSKLARHLSFSISKTMSPNWLPLFFSWLRSPGLVFSPECIGLEYRIILLTGIYIGFCG